MSAVGIYKAIESMASPALPIVQEQLGATRAEIAWVITGVLLTGPIVTPLVGRLGDIYNKRTVL
ncbi:MFS transporter, partial [Clavibacter michiganensis]|uniref:MFS transporter n=2 Tax=Actinomycetes TaxID=1760 RepID=UPI00374E1DE2